MEDKQTLLKVEHLCQYFPMNGSELKAVDDVSFDIKKGEVFGLVGESGCGKTTTGRSVIKLYNITSGNVYFKGSRISAGTRSYYNEIETAKKDFKEGKISLSQCTDIIKQAKYNIKLAKRDNAKCNKIYSDSLVKKIKEEYQAAEKPLSQEQEKEFKERLRVAKKEKLTTQIQMIFQDPVASLNPRMTVRETISEGLKIKGIKDKKYLNEQVYKMLDLVGLVHEHAERYPHEFSGGQRQRIGIARSIIMQPELIIADEPISALDVSIQAQVINLLNDLRRELGLTILFIAHDLSVVKYFSDRIGVMYYGKLVELADSDELFRHPLHPYTKSLLSAIPLPDPEYERTCKRIVYDPLVSHDYSTDKPVYREIKDGHFVYCNEAEFARYKEEIEK